MKKIMSLMLLAFVGFLLSGCGQGGGGGAPVDTPFGNSLPPSTGAGDVENFFPDAPGTSWNYFATVDNPPAGAPSSFMDSVTVTGTKAIGGQTASVFLNSNPSGDGIPLEGYYYKNAGGVAFLGTNDVTDMITAGMVPYIVGLRNGGEYLVSWTIMGYANTGSTGVQAARVSTTGVLPSGANMTIPVSGPPPASTISQLTNPVMASGPQHGAIIWFDNQVAAKVLAGVPFSPF